ncbi:MAG: ABC transporter ATP-binding protein [Actinobacteria bacterium]|nr:ABC transporter ATP-binding protein [Actinomycetota bacterium]
MAARTAESADAARSASLADQPVAISIRNVSKDFELPHERVSTLKQRVLRTGRYSFETLNALSGVDFDIREGEFFGIVGRNGSGKSTLLKCIAGIYPVDEGEIRVAGKVASIIELGVGFNPELDARDNVLLNAQLLGLSAEQAEARFASVIEFAELEKFVDLKLKNYSSGMFVRLAFAVAIHVDADVLLVDEVLAVGDASFQHKCFREFERIKQKGTTVCFVTHDVTLVERFCTRAVLLDRGEIRSFGYPIDVARDYVQINLVDSSPAPASGDAGEPAGDGAARVERLGYTDADGNPTTRSKQGERGVITAGIRFERDVYDPLIEFEIADADNHLVFFTSTVLDDVSTGDFKAGETAEFRLEFENLLEDGYYALTVRVKHRDGRQCDASRPGPGFLVVGRVLAKGVVNVDHRLELRR